MTRPAQDYDTRLQLPSFVTTYDSCGTLMFSSTTPVVLSRRSLRRDASVSTAPRRGGNFSIPTSYSSSGGHWSSFGPATVYLRNTPPGPGIAYRQEWSMGSMNDIGFNPRTLYALPSSVTNLLLIKVLNRLRNSDVNFGVMLAEAKETAELFQTSLGRITSMVNSFRRRRPKDFALARAHQGTASWRKTPQAWLELQYGWNPLMSDIYGSCALLDSSKTRERNFVTVKGKKEIKTTVSQNLVACNGSVSIRQETDVVATQKIKLCYTLSNFNLALLSQLGLTNPAEIIWERVPYSFVVDWFLPVGQWLSALGGDFGYSFKNGSLTNFYRYSEVRRSVVSSPGPAFVPDVRGSAFYLQRSLFTSSPWPGLSFKSPVSPTHLANALSLLTQAFRKR